MIKYGQVAPYQELPKKRRRSEVSVPFQW